MLRSLVVWATGVVLWYCISLATWINPRIIKYGLPFLGTGTAPDIPLFLWRVAAFSAAIFLVIAAGRGAGRTVARFVGLPAAAALRSVPVGWGVLGALFLGLGLAGLWFKPVFAVILVPAVAAGVVRLAPWIGNFRKPGVIWRSPAFVLPVALAGWMLLLLCLAPEFFQDPLRYHLFFPRRFLFEHKFIFVERYFFWSYMGYPQMLYGAALALGGGITAKAVNVAAALLSLVVLLRIVRRAGFDEPTQAVIMGLTVTSPGLMLVTGATFGEHGAMLCVLLAVEALMRESEPRGMRLRSACLFGGLAFSAKYTAIFGGIGCLVLLAGRADRGRWIAAAIRRPWWIAMLAIPVLPYAAERWVWTGDPVSPYFGRAGFATMDSSSASALDVYYDFAGKIRRKWLKDPESMLLFPVNFAGSHGGFWEHAGPVVPALIPLLLFADRFGPGARQLLLFFAGSFGVWLAFFGGQSPHYVAGLAGIWTAGMVGAASGLAPAVRLLLRNLFSFTAFFQALVCVVSVTYMFGPRDVAMGTISREYYLANSLAPPLIHYPIRRDLMRKYPGRGCVYVLGDDTSYYLDGRIFTDYENGSDPLIWRLAEASPDPGRMRIRLRQRGITHVLYSTRWPDILCEQGDEKFRFDDPVMRRMQEFWRMYARPVLVLESNAGPVTPGSYVFLIVETPESGPYRADFCNRLPFLPGAAVLVWEGDVALSRGDTGRAEAFYARQAEKHPSCAILQDRLARTAFARGRPDIAIRHLRRMGSVSWASPGLRGR
jgi:hypothetical protein